MSFVVSSKNTSVTILVFGIIYCMDFVIRPVLKIQWKLKYYICGQDGFLCSGNGVNRNLRRWARYAKLFL